MPTRMLTGLIVIVLLSIPSLNAHPFGQTLSEGDIDPNFFRWVHHADQPPTLEWRSPRLWLSPSFGTYSSLANPKKMLPDAKDDWKNGSLDDKSLIQADVKEGSDNSIDRQASNEETDQGLYKRDSYLSMCHFKICNLGRKRRFSYLGASPSSPVRFPLTISSN